jgi:hypothetical protein
MPVPKGKPKFVPYQDPYEAKLAKGLPKVDLKALEREIARPKGSGIRKLVAKPKPPRKNPGLKSRKKLADRLAEKGLDAL